MEKVRCLQKALRVCSSVNRIVRCGEEYNAFGEAGKEHLKAKKVKAEIDKVLPKFALNRFARQFPRRLVSSHCRSTGPRTSHKCSCHQVQEQLALMEKNKSRRACFDGHAGRKKHQRHDITRLSAARRQCRKWNADNMCKTAPGLLGHVQFMDA